MGIRGEIFSWRVTSNNEKRTYFFNVKENRMGDVFLNVVESKKGDVEFERHQVVVFQDDIESFMDGLNKAMGFMKRKRK